MLLAGKSYIEIIFGVYFVNFLGVICAGSKRIPYTPDF